MFVDGYGMKWVRMSATLHPNLFAAGAKALEAQALVDRLRPDFGRSGPSRIPLTPCVPGAPRPAAEERLLRLGISRPLDLLFLLPQRYEDRTRLTPPWACARAWPAQVAGPAGRR